jgi:predicted aspartyl protease
MKKIYLFLLLFVFAQNILCFGQAESYDQKIASLINQGKWFELRHEYQKNKDSLSEFMKLCAGGLIGYYFYDPQETVSNFEVFTDKYAEQLGASSIDFICLLAEGYAECGNYEKAAFMYNSLIGQLTNILPKNQINKFKSNSIRYSFYDKKENLLSLVKSEGKESRIPVEIIDGGIFFTVSSNSQEYKAIFDTGASMNIISEKVADELNMEYAEESIIFNETIQVKLAIADAISINGIIINNVPFVVTGNDSIANSFDYPFDMVIGTDVMKLLETIHIDLNNRELIVSPGKTASVPEPNMVYINNTTYVNLNINGNDILFFYDSGYNGELIINPDAVKLLGLPADLKENSKESHNFMSAKGAIHADVTKIGNVNIKLSENKTVSPTSYIGTLNLGSKYASGMIGKTLLEFSGHIIIDFKNMHICFTGSH